MGHFEFKIKHFSKTLLILCVCIKCAVWIYVNKTMHRHLWRYVYVYTYSIHNVWKTIFWHCIHNSSTVFRQWKYWHRSL